MEDVMRTTGIYPVAVLTGFLAIGALVLGGCSHESADWKSASTTDTAEAYQQFLNEHPGSAHATAAQARVKSLAEDHDWQAAAAADTRDAYEQFVAQHADSKWAQEARIRIENFAQGGTGATGNPATQVAATNAPAMPVPDAATKSAAAAEPIAKPVPPGKVASGSTEPSHSTKPAAAKSSAQQSGASHVVHAHYAQLGAFSSKERAQSQWKTLSLQFPAQLKSLKPDYVAGTSKHGKVYRLRVPMSSVAAAKGLCGTLKKHAQTCVPVTA
jgi:hypothetical protein